MKSKAELLTDTLWNFCQHYISSYQDTHGELPKALIDEQHASLCEQDKIDSQHTFWQPIKIDDELSFENVGQALELSLHPDITTYFTTVYSDSIPATAEDGDLELLFAWSRHDFERLQENIIGHVLMKRQLKQPITIFFAVTDQEDIILTMDNDSGAIWAERVGCEPHKKLADNIQEFLASLTVKVD